MNYFELFVIEEEQSSITIMKSVDNDENVEDVGKMTKTKIRTESLGEDGRDGGMILQ